MLRSMVARFQAQLPDLLSIPSLPDAERTPGEGDAFSSEALDDTLGTSLSFEEHDELLGVSLALKAATGAIVYPGTKAKPPITRLGYQHH